MRMLVPFLLASLVVPAVATARAPAEPTGNVPAYITAAMNDPARAADKVDDQRRQMAAVLTLSGVKPGDDVLELLPATGYWTRAFSQIVGRKGHVYTVWPEKSGGHASKNLVKWQKLVKTPHYANVSVLPQHLSMLSSPKLVDIVFTDDNYHDFHNPSMSPLNMREFDQRAYKALKPGGVFVIVDHIAPAGSGTSDTNTLHRIDPAAVKAEVESAGFVFDGSSDALLNPKDPLTDRVFDKSIRGHTSQFIYRFRKPMK